MKTAFELIKERLDKTKQELKSKPNRFQEAENEGRLLFTRWCYRLKMIPVFDQSEVSASDAYDAIANNNYYEIKYKKNKQYQDMQNLIQREGLMLEEKKFNALKEIWLKDKTKDFYYIMFFEDKTLIHQINFNKEYKAKIYNCPKTTVGDNQYIEKVCYMIPSKDLSISNTIR